jgi:hypothetical protein
MRHYSEIRGVLMETIMGLTDDQMVDPSIDGWSVKDHLAHLIVWHEIRLLEIERISAGWDTAWPHMTPDQAETFNAITTDLRRGLPLQQVMDELEVARERVLDAIASATERGLDERLYGEAGLRSRHEEQHAEWINQWRLAKRI